MTIDIRRVRNTDDLLQTAIAAEVFDHDIDEAALEAYLEEPGHFMCVAIARGEVVGQARAIVHRHPDGPGELYIDNVGVAPAFQRRGIATRLVREIVRLGREYGCAETWVGTEPGNEPAMALYRSLELNMTPMVMFDGVIRERAPE